MASPSYTLEHFYHGQVTSGGRGQGELRLLAASAEISADLVNEAISAARVPPDAGSTLGAWALVRGSPTPFFLVQSILSSSGQPLRHFVVVPIEVLRVLGGNLSALHVLLQTEMPAYDSINNTLAPITLSTAAVPTPEAQAEAMLALLDTTRDRFDAVDALLAALVQGVVIYVHHAPDEVSRRVRFVEGLLALLPPPARFGVTFTTHCTPQTALDAQIRFSTDDPVPDNVLLFDWATAKVSGMRVEDEYSRYIKSLLRLDIDQVIEQTAALTPVAGWRIRRGDDLSTALRYASHRLKIDSGLLNNQPIEVEDAARILIEDPTLTPDLRAAYIRHLLAFAMALDDLEQADLLAVAARGQPESERIIIEAMDSAITAGKVDQVYRLVSRWVGDARGFKGMDWGDLLRRALLAHAAALVGTALKDAEGRAAVRDLLMQVQHSAPALGLTEAAPALFEAVFPLARQDAATAKAAFMLAAALLESDKWLKIRHAKPLIARLPANIARFLAMLDAKPGAEPAPLGLLTSAVQEVEALERPLLTVRLAEMAVANRRADLLDGEAMMALANASAGETGTRYSLILLTIARALADDAALTALDANGRRAVLQILLARGAYTELAGEISRQSRLFYPPDKQTLLGLLVRGLFAETAIPLSEVGDVLHTLSTRGVKPLPLAMAYLGVLSQFHYSPTLEAQISELTDLIQSNRMLTEAVPPDQILELVRYHGARRSGPAAARLAALLPIGAARRGAAGLSAMVELYRRLDWNDEMRLAALDALRRYVRRLPDQAAPTAIAAISRQLGGEVKEALETTLILRRMMGGEQFGDYAYSLHTLAQFLYDTTLTYIDKTNVPSISMLVSDLDSLSGGLDNAEREAIAATLGELVRLIYAAAAQHRAARTREDARGDLARAEQHHDGLLAGRGLVSSAVEVFRTMGGYFAQGRRFSVRADREVREHPLAGRAVHLLLREAQQNQRLLTNTLLTLPPDKRVALSAPALHAEVESLWNDLSLAERRSLVRGLAVDLQRIAELILIACERVDPKVLQDDSALTRKLEGSRQRPENVLEFYRFVGGYFRARAQ